MIQESRKHIIVTCLLLGTACVVLMLSGVVNDDDVSQYVRRLSTTSTMGIIHLGKCGGVSMERTIKSGLTPNIIHKRDPEYYHLNPPEVDKYQEWIALVRDPVERMQSSWIYEHPDNSQYRRDRIGKFVAGLRLKFYDCYPTLDQALIVGLMTPSIEENDCPMLAKKIFSGVVDQKFFGMAHFKFNFAFYYTELLQKAASKKIFIVRTERMVQDLNSVSTILGGTGAAFKNTMKFAHFNITDIPMQNRDISPLGLTNLCSFLCEEIQMYKQLLSVAANLSPMEVHTQTILPQLAVKCPAVTARNRCPEKTDLWGKNLVSRLGAQ